MNPVGRDVRVFEMAPPASHAHAGRIMRYNVLTYVHTYIKLTSKLSGRSMLVLRVGSAAFAALVEKIYSIERGEAR